MPYSGNNGGGSSGTGQQGPPGQAATIAVGTVTTLDPGSQATAANSGTTSAAVIDLGIPQGATGDTGEPGKSAFAYAQDGGFAGNEQQFASILNSIGDIEAALRTV